MTRRTILKALALASLIPAKTALAGLLPSKTQTILPFRFVDTLVTAGMPYDLPCTRCGESCGHFTRGYLREGIYINGNERICQFCSKAFHFKAAVHSTDPRYAYWSETHDLYLNGTNVMCRVFECNFLEGWVKCYKHDANRECVVVYPHNWPQVEAFTLTEKLYGTLTLKRQVVE